MVGGLVLAALALGAALLWFRRFPGRDPELAWRGVVGLATRLGAGPQPSQTPYEYAATLSRVVPTAARDLRVVADAKVDASYSDRLAEEADRPATPGCLSARPPGTAAPAAPTRSGLGSPSAGRWSARLWARSRACPARTSTTVMAHSAKGSAQ